MDNSNGTIHAHENLNCKRERGCMHWMFWQNITLPQFFSSFALYIFHTGIYVSICNKISQSILECKCVDDSINVLHNIHPASLTCHRFIVKIQSIWRKIPINQSINQSINQPINQSTNQSINQSIKPHLLTKLLVRCIVRCRILLQV